MLHSSFMLLSFITFKSFKWYNIKASITQVSEGKRRAFHHEINSISRAGSTHTGKGEIFVLREKHSYFKSTNVAHCPWLLLCWPKFPPGGMVRFLPKTRNLKKVGFRGPDQESAKVSKKLFVDFDRVVGDDPSQWARSLGSLLKGKVVFRRYFSKEYRKGEVKNTFPCLTHLWEPLLQILGEPCLYHMGQRYVCFWA